MKSLIHNKIVLKYWVLIPVFITLAAVIYYSLQIVTLELGYDEAYNLQVAKNLAIHGVYATNGAVFDGSLKLFDPNITTGSPLLLFIALIFKLFGVGVWQYRLVTFLVFITLIALTIFIIWMYNKNRSLPKQHTAILACIAVLLILLCTTPENLLLATGEPLALLLLLASFAALSRFIFLAGLFAGLAVLTKTLFLIGIPALLVSLLLHNRKDKPRLTIQLLLGLSLPIILFEIYRFSSFDFSAAAYIQNIKDNVHFFQIAGSGVTENSSSILSQLQTKIYNLVPNSSSVTLSIFILLLLLPLAYLYMPAVALSKKVVRYLKSYDHLTVLVATTLLLWTSWFLFISDRSWQRHGFPIILFGALLFFFYIARNWKSFSKRQRFTTTSYVTSLVIIMSVSVFYIFSPLSPKLSTQLSFINQITPHYENQQIYHSGWWQVPEVQFILNMKSKDINLAQQNQSVDLLLSVLQKQQAPTTYVDDLSHCDSILPLNTTYTICRINGDVNK